MITHFNLPIDYCGKTFKIKVQILSILLPKTIYVVWPKGELLKHFKNVRQMYFHINSEIYCKKKSELKFYVFYDYLESKVFSKDIYFEFAVWSSLLRFHN